jgi:hypothetical protein
LSSASDAYIQVNRGSITSLFGTDNVGTYIGQQGAYDLRLVTNATERARIDSSGRLLVGTSSAFYSTTVKLQGNSASSTDESRIRLCRGTASPANGDTLAILGFSDNTETPSAEIAAQRDGGTWSASSVPGRLVFSTTADGASSPTERMRLDSSGDVRLSLGSSQSRTLSFHNTTSNITYATINYEDVSGRLTLSDSYGIAFNTVAGGGAASNATEAARIDNSGRLLVGTSSSVALDNPHKVQIAGSQRPLSMWVGTANSDGAYLSFGKSRNTTYGSYTAVQNGDELGAIAFLGDDGTDYATPGAYIQAFVDGNPGTNDMPGRLVFSTTADGASTPTERMRIASNGFFRASNLGSYNDPVNGNYHEFRSSVNSTIILRVEHTSNVSGNGTFSSVLGSNCDNTSSYHFTANANGDRMRVYGNGNIVNTNNSYGAISDIKLKENIVDANSQWDDLKALQVRNYNFKEGQTHTQIGLVAQEVELVSPGLVTESPDRDEDGNDLGTVTKSVNYSVLYMKAVKALQEAMERIEQLEAKVAALESA